MRALPDIEGPKLRAFRGPNGAAPVITFLDFIGKGVHGYALKVSINGEIHCLKAFKWIEAGKFGPAVFQCEPYTVAEAAAMLDPFNSECRAYARMKEAEREHLAARCHGYVLLTKKDEKLLADRFHIHEWDRGPRNARSHVRALIKDFVDSRVAFSARQVPRMRRNLLGLHRIGIVVYDVKEDAYVDGRLVDLSQAYTTPHVMYDTTDRRWRTTTLYMAWGDRSLFDSMLDDSDDPSLTETRLWRFQPWRFRERLRPRPFRDFRGRDDFVYVDPGKYDWRKASRSGRKGGGSKSR